MIRRNLLLLAFMVFAVLTSANPALGSQLRFTDNSPLSQGGADADFLPVEQAYQLFGRVLEDGGEQRLQLDWIIAPGYYLYKHRFHARLANPKGKDTPLEQQLPPGVSHYDDYYEKELEVYYHNTTATITLPGNLTDAVVIVESQGCADAGLCYPPRSQYLSINFTTGAVAISEQGPDSSQEKPAANQQPLELILLFAMLGGVLLNLMPCVFPVLSIKVLSLTGSHLSAHGRHLHGLAYTGGVVLAFIAVALAMILLRAGGEAIGWGFQLQSPAFITALVYLFFLMGLGFSGFFTAGARLMNFGQTASSGSQLHHSFLTGVLATLVASPCSAPFMGAALGFALTQPTVVALLIFATLGLGMALPFLLLTWFPWLLNRLPKPGPWMQTLKELLAFPLYLTCIWLLWILGHQTDADTLIVILTGLVLLAFAIWLGNGDKKYAKLLAAMAIVGALLLPVYQLDRENAAEPWEPYSEQRLNQLLDDGQSVFINLTADWCITCLANEKFALGSTEFFTLLAEQRITYLKGDWTNYDREITALLNANGRSGVPLYLYYPKGQTTPVVLPQILSKATVIDALRQD